MFHRHLLIPLVGRCRRAHATASLAVVAVVAACGLADVFAAVGVGDVRFEWMSESELQTAQVVAIRVRVLVNGQPLEAPRLVVTIPDTTIIAPNATGDSIVARRSGRGDVHVELVSSVATGDHPDTTFSIRVTGGGPTP